MSTINKQALIEWLKKEVEKVEKGRNFHRGSVNAVTDGGARDNYLTGLLHGYEYSSGHILAMASKPSDAGLIVWGMARWFQNPSDYFPNTHHIMRGDNKTWILFYRDDIDCWNEIDLGAGDLPILIPEARAILEPEWRKENG